MADTNAIISLADILRQRQDEAAFQDWYRAWSRITGVNPNPDDPRHFYDNRAAFRAGAIPQIDPTDGRYHWPSQFKAPGHPNRFVGGIDTITGRPVPAQPLDWATWLRQLTTPRESSKPRPALDTNTP